MSSRPQLGNTASTNVKKSLLPSYSVEDDAAHYKMRYQRTKPQKPKLNLLGALDETNEQSKHSLYKPDASSEQYEAKQLLDSSVLTFRNTDECINADETLRSEPPIYATDDSLMSFQNFQGFQPIKQHYDFKKQTHLDLSLSTLNSTNMIIEPLSPKSKMSPEKLNQLEELFDKSDNGELKPVNVFHCVGTTYKLDMVKRGLSGMLGKLDKQT